LPEDETPSGNDTPEGEDEPRIEPEVVDEQPEVAAYPVAGEVIQLSATYRQAPYPAPDELREYETIHPGFTDRILTLTERETDHRIQQERLQDSATITLAKRGQICAFIVVMTFAVGGLLAILTDHSIAGLAGLVIAAATLAGAFLGPRLLSERSGGTADALPGAEIERQATPATDNPPGRGT
jgi:uncharacterized membrane protein